MKGLLLSLPSFFTLSLLQQKSHSTISNPIPYTYLRRFFILTLASVHFYTCLDILSIALKTSTASPAIPLLCNLGLLQSKQKNIVTLETGAEALFKKLLCLHQGIHLISIYIYKHLLSSSTKLWWHLKKKKPAFPSFHVWSHTKTVYGVSVQNFVEKKNENFYVIDDA